MSKKFRKTVFMVTYSRDNEKILYLVLKRKMHWSGWEFPKGGIEKNENPFQTVKREIMEETGSRPIKIKKFNFRGRYFYPRKIPSRGDAIGQSFSLYSVEIKFGKIKFDAKEHSDCKWLEFDDAVKKLTFENQKKCLTIVNNKIIGKT